MKVGVSSDFWNNYELDIKLAEELGQNSVLRDPCTNAQDKAPHATHMQMYSHHAARPST